MTNTALTQEAAADLSATLGRLRKDVLEMITAAGSGHPGGSLSALDLIASLYARHLRQTAATADDVGRDRFVLSKGHGVPALYAVLAEHGYIAHESLKTLRKLGSPLQGHPVVGTIPGIEACTGSLGQGLSIAVGLALAAKLDGRDSRIWCLMGDGEMQEGQVWEALMSASKFMLGNLIAIVDSNKAQIDGLVKDVMPLDPIEDKVRSFGFEVRTIDGHDLLQIDEAFTWASKDEGKPKFIVANTIKGKGVSFMEQNLVGWHGVAPTAEQLAQAVAEFAAKVKGALS
jgi:transketolase